MASSCWSWDNEKTCKHVNAIQNQEVITVWNSLWCKFSHINSSLVPHDIHVMAMIIRLSQKEMTNICRLASLEELYLMSITWYTGNTFHWKIKWGKIKPIIEESSTQLIQIWNQVCNKGEKYKELCWKWPSVHNFACHSQKKPNTKLIKEQ